MQLDAPLDKLGSLRLFNILLFEVFGVAKPMSLIEIKDYCISREYGVAPSILPSLNFLSWLGFVERQDDDYSLSKAVSAYENLLETPNRLPVMLAQMTLSKLQESSADLSIFSEGTITRDSTGKLYLSTSKIANAWMGLVVLLRNLNLIHDGPIDTGLLHIDQEIADLFVSAVLSIQAIPPKRRGLTLEQLKRLLEKQATQGTDAEKFVLSYEQRRLSGHPKVNLIKRISDEDTGAGFDIVSFETENSIIYDRFIEVKSFKTERRFYWSKGEYNAAKMMGKAYFIYLVDIKLIGDSKYVPEIFNNPVSLEQNGIWEMIPENWLIIP